MHSHLQSDNRVWMILSSALPHHGVRSSHGSDLEIDFRTILLRRMMPLLIFLQMHYPEATENLVLVSGYRVLQRVIQPTLYFQTYIRYRIVQFLVIYP